MWSFVGNKQHPVWHACALDHQTREMVSFNIGRRSSEMLEPIITTHNNSSAQRIYTDKFSGYRKLIAPTIHTCSKIESTSNSTIPHYTYPPKTTNTQNNLPQPEYCDIDYYTQDLLLGITSIYKINLNTPQ